MDSWEKIDETSLPHKEDFYSSPNMKNITGAVYRHAERVLTYLKIKI